MSPESLTKLVVDCSSQTGLAASVPGILEQAAEAARAGDAEATASLLTLAQERAAAAISEPAVETSVPLDAEALAQQATDAAAAADADAATIAAARTQLRAKRDSWLARTDWMFLDQLPTDTPADTVKAVAANKAAWTTFRQALRDLPDTTSDPTNISWPTPPDAPAMTLT